MKSTLSYFEIAQDLSPKELKIAHTIYEFICSYEFYKNHNIDDSKWKRLTKVFCQVYWQIGKKRPRSIVKGRLAYYVKSVNYFVDIYQELEKQGQLPFSIINGDISTEVEHCRNYHLL